MLSTQYFVLPIAYAVLAVATDATTVTTTTTTTTSTTTTTTTVTATTTTMFTEGPKHHISKAMQHTSIQTHTPAHLRSSRVACRDPPNAVWLLQPESCCGACEALFNSRSRVRILRLIWVIFTDIRNSSHPLLAVSDTNTRVAQRERWHTCQHRQHRRASGLFLQRVCRGGPWRSQYVTKTSQTQNQ